VSQSSHSIQRLVVAAGVTLLSLALVPRASASFDYWYFPQPWSASSSGEGCWQVGTPPTSPAYSCDTIGAGYLPSHTVQGGGNPGFPPWNYASGDYCTYYGLPQFNYGYPYDSSPWTGFQTPTPYSSYDWSGAGGLCSAAGNRRGAYMSNSGAGNTCAIPNDDCGVQHSVSFGSQGLNDRPWSAAFGSNPVLVLANYFDPHYFSVGPSANGWGYLCARLEDTTQPAGNPNLIEFCLEDWQIQPPGCGCGWPQVDQVHNPTYPSPYYQVITSFGPGTYYATELPGSSNTTSSTGGLSNRLYEASISADQLWEAAYWINAAHWGPPLSLNPADYALVGLEDGAEGWYNLYGLGYSSSLLVAYTQY